VRRVREVSYEVVSFPFEWRAEQVVALHEAIRDGIILFYARMERERHGQE
jgi:hypothetical protein